MNDKVMSTFSNKVTERTNVIGSLLTYNIICILKLSKKFIYFQYNSEVVKFRLYLSKYINIEVKFDKKNFLCDYDVINLVNYEIFVKTIQ